MNADIQGGFEYYYKHKRYYHYRRIDACKAIKEPRDPEDKMEIADILTVFGLIEEGKTKNNRRRSAFFDGERHSRAWQVARGGTRTVARTPCAPAPESCRTHMPHVVLQWRAPKRRWPR